MGNMYDDSVKRVSNVMVGCEWDCIYCKPSFQAQMRRQVHNCQLCGEYIPHFHEERLEQKLPHTRGDQFIWLVRSGDPCFAKPSWMEKILQRIEELPHKTFFLQTKDPLSFERYNNLLPSNLLLGITLETNRDQGYELISKAPLPSIRAEQFEQVEHSRKCITIEPLLDFDIKELKEMIIKIDPERIYIGYNSKTKRIQLSEPPLFKTRKLINDLRNLGYKVKEKLMRNE